MVDGMTDVAKGQFRGMAVVSVKTYHVAVVIVEL